MCSVHVWECDSNEGGRGGWGGGGGGGREGKVGRVDSTNLKPFSSTIN